MRMFGEEVTINRRCLLTLSGAKIQAVLITPKPKKTMLHDVMEREFVNRFNESQLNAVNKCVAAHIMRN